MSNPYTKGAGVADLSGTPSIGKSLPVGTNTGDFIRFNAGSSAWEVAVEPLSFKGLILTPALTSLVDIEGALYYNSTEKAVKVCTSV